LGFDLKGEEFYNTISALHKSMRGSDPDSALYWLGRMLEAGQDPLYIARRVIRFASEDIGIEDPKALVVATSAFKACEVVGMPECELALAEAVVYMAKSPKSNQIYIAYEKVKEDVQKYGNLPVPLEIRNPVTKFMGSIGYGKGYKYEHSKEAKKTDQEYMPEKLKGKKYL
jgi:putative ATPase